MAAASVVVSVAAALHVNDTNDLLRIANTPHHREGTRLFETCCTNHGKRKEPPIWAQGARAGDPLFFSSLYTKTCTQTRSAETADATYGRLPRSRAGRRRAQACGARRSAQPRRHRCEAAASVGYAHAPGGEATMAGRGAWRLDGGARRVETIAPSSPPPVLLGRRPTSPCNAPTLPCHRARRGGVGDAGGIEPACTDAPDGARPRGERKDALDTVALRRCRAQVVASIVIAAAAASSSLGVKP